MSLLNSTNPVTRRTALRLVSAPIITLSLSRNREGTIDGHLDRESSFDLKQLRSTTATSAP